MRLHIIARGRIGRSPEAELVERYMQRISWPVKITELPERGGKMPAGDKRAKIVMLDEKGTALSSVKFARKLEQWQFDAVPEVRFLIGGADGFDDQQRAGADLLFSFGKATWPHLLARAMLAEQLYRATSIIAGHPYHREG